jgi:hypothetical protein
MSTGGGCGRDTAGRCIVQLDDGQTPRYLAPSGFWVFVAEFARVFGNKGHAKSAIRRLRWHQPPPHPKQFKIIPVKLEISGTPEVYSIE